MSESVWDYPRPPRLERTGRRIRVMYAGEVIADSVRCFRLLETSHPPVYYIPPSDVRKDLLTRSRRRTFCEYKGPATYWCIRVGDQISNDAAWSYENASGAYIDIRGYLAFYANRADECYVDGERVNPQPGAFYGGWITSDIIGPFKGGPGTSHW
jgi:uncharacterized protein (DUF427 family)